MCKDCTDYSTRNLLWEWGKLLSSYQMPSCVCHIQKLQVDAKEALTNGYQRGPRWQSWWSLSWKFQWHSKKTICEWKTSRMDTCVHVLLRNISFSGFPSGSTYSSLVDVGQGNDFQWFQQSKVMPARLPAERNTETLNFSTCSTRFGCGNCALARRWCPAVGKCSPSSWL